jgi:hypothetical protein
MTLAMFIKMVNFDDKKTFGNAANKHCFSLVTYYVVGYYGTTICNLSADNSSADSSPPG